MLVLTRRPSEYVRITVPASTEPTQIDVCLVHSYSGGARIGFRAPTDTVIGREELYERAPSQVVPVAEAATDVTAV